MEDVKRRLQFKNSFMQMQAVQKLQSLIVARCGGKTSLTTISKQDVELGFLWSQVGSVDLVIDSSCCDALVALVKTMTLDYGYVLNGLLNVLPTCSNICGIVQSVSQLLVIQVAAQVKLTNSYRCPYGIRTPPHPFITIVTYKPDCWPLLVREVTNLCCPDSECGPVNGVKMLSPFLKFVLNDPSSPGQHAQLRSNLVTALLQGFTTSECVLEFLVSVIPSLQISSQSCPTETSTFLQSVTNTVMKGGYHGNAGYLRQLTNHLLCLCTKMTSDGIDSVAILCLLCELVAKYPQALHGDYVVLQISSLLQVSPAHHLHHLLLIAKHALDESECQLVMAILVLPLLQVVSLSSTHVPACKTSTQNEARKLLVDIERKLENVQEKPNQKTHPDNYLHLSPEGYKYATGLKVALWLNVNPGARLTWLEAIMSRLQERSSSVVSRLVTSLVTGILVCSDQMKQTHVALKCLALIAKQEPTQAPGFLPLLLFKLEREGEPDSVLDILCTLPQLATHKVSVPKVLQTLLSLVKFDALRPVCIRLLTTLWTLEDRCFPQLLQVLTTASKHLDSGGVELKISVATSLMEICSNRPEQHGRDVLHLLSDMLNCSCDNNESIPASLALQGLVSLCEAEVVDIRTTWDVLSSTLLKDNRPIVIKTLCKFFALVPQLTVNTAEYEVFSHHILDILWMYTQRDSHLIANSAFEALSKFSPTLFQPHHLPTEVRELLKLPDALEDDESSEEDGLGTVHIQGQCFTKLLTFIDPKVLPGFQVFLLSLVKQELGEMPRSVFQTSSVQKKAVGSLEKSLADIPAFLQTAHRSNQQPGMKEYLAASMLFTYNPPVEMTKDGNPRKRNLVTRATGFHHMTRSLLLEIPLHKHMSFHMAAGWAVLIGRLFQACVEGNNAELELQVQLGKIDEELIDSKKASSWLVARDRVTDLVTNEAVKGPLAQANCLLALCSLSACVTQYATREPATASLEAGHINPTLWQKMVLNTVLSFIDPTLSCGESFDLNQKKYGLSRASLLAQAMAPLALSQISTSLIQSGTDHVKKVVDMVTAQLPGQAHSTDFPYPWLHAMGMGTMLSRLLQEDSEVTLDSEEDSCIWSSIRLLEDACFNKQTRNSQGLLLGLRNIILALCQTMNTENKEYIVSVFNQLMDILDESDVDKVYLEEVYECIASLTAAGCAVNLLDSNHCNQVLRKFNSLYEQNGKSQGLCHAVGQLCSISSCLGLTTVHQTAEAFRKDWLTKVHKNKPDVSCLVGLASLTASDRVAFTNLLDQQSDWVSSCLPETVKTLKKIVDSSADITVQGHAVWLLSNIHASLASGFGDLSGNVPSSYNYLPDTSVIKAVANELTPSTKQEYREDCLEVLLESLDQTVLPPVNWMSLLTPVMRITKSQRVQTLCLRIALKQMPSSPSAITFISTWITSPLFDGLHLPSKELLLKSLVKLARYCSPAKVESFLEYTLCQLHDEKSDMNEKHEDLMHHLLSGLRDSLCESGLAVYVTSVLHTTVERIGNYLPSHNEDDCCSVYAECLSFLPDASIDRVIQRKDEDFLQAAYMSCWLVGQGKQPIAILNALINTFINQESGKSRQAHVLAICFWCFSEMLKEKSLYNSAMTRMEWFLELIGHLKNTIMKAETGVSQLLQVCMSLAAIVTSCWCDEEISQLYALNTTFNQDLVMDIMQGTQMSHLLPAALPSLLGAEPWNQIQAKVITWVTTLLQVSVEDHVISRVLEGCLLSLRDSPEFRKVTVWGEAYSLI